jgi:hypothetical protein
MLIAKGVPSEKVKNLKLGDSFLGDEIVRLLRENSFTRIHTRAGKIFTLHQKPWGYNVFLVTKNKNGEEKT